MYVLYSPNSITPTLRRPWQVPNKIADLLWTQIMKVHDTNHVANFNDMCCGLSWFVFATKSVAPTFLEHCNGPNSIRVTETGLSRSCHGLWPKHLDMSKWFLSATFVICVGDFHWNFMISWVVIVCVHDFHDLCPRLSPQRSFGESQHDGIWTWADRAVGQLWKWLASISWTLAFSYKIFITSAYWSASLDLPYLTWALSIQWNIGQRQLLSN